MQPKEEFILAYGFRGIESITAGKAWQISSRTRKLAGHISNSTQKARQNRKVTNPQSSPNSNVILTPTRLHLLRVL